VDEPPAEPPAPEGPAAPPLDPRLVLNAQAAIAERFAEMAQDTLRQPVITEAMWRQAAALLDAAHELDKADPRYLRLQFEIALKVNNLDKAIAALSEYRRLVPDDLRAQTQLIDLYVSRMEKVDDKLAYLAGDENKPGLVQQAHRPAELRSHAATLAVPLLLDRDPKLAPKMLDEALALNPLNTTALRLKYSLLPEDASVSTRTGVLLDWLKANPAQPAAMTELADKFAGLGLSVDAAKWYYVALPQFARSGQSVPNGFVAAHATQLFLLGQADAATGLLKQYLTQRPLDADAWFVWMAIERTRPQPDAEVLVNAREAMVKRWRLADDRIANRPPAPPPPPPAEGEEPPPPPPPPDPAVAIEYLKKPDAPDENKQAFTNTIGDLAWLELYFANDPEAADPWVKALAAVLPPESVTLGRLNGWTAVLKEDDEATRKLLEPIAKEDPIAAAGLIRLVTDKAAGDAEAVRLLGENRSGVVAALLMGELKARGVKPPVPTGKEVQTVRAQIAKFPTQILPVLEQPQAYYTVRVEPYRVAHRFREEVYVRVSIENISTFDLTIGPDGLIRPDLWFDAQIGGLVNKMIGGVAFDRLAGPLVLKPKQSTPGQVIRFDQGQLLDLLDANPGATVQIVGFAMTNPVGTAKSIAPGPGGQRVQFTKGIVRAGFNVGNGQAQKGVLQILGQGLPSAKIAAMDLLATYVKLIAREPKQTPQMRQLTEDFLHTIGTMRGDMPLVATFANYELAQLYPDPLERQQAVNLLAADTGWVSRMLALEAARASGMKLEAQIDIASGMARDDTNEVVKAYAAATVDLLKNPPATQPAAATQPVATQPGAAAQPGADTQPGSATQPDSATQPGPATQPVKPPAAKGGVPPIDIGAPIPDAKPPSETPTVPPGK
jgi:tetratricopeptide (TPR) repeat protein